MVLVKKELTRRGSPRRRTVVQRGDLIITEHSEARFALPVRYSFCRAYPVITGNCIVLSIRKSSLPICENASLLPRCLVMAFFARRAKQVATKLSFGHVRKTLDWVGNGAAQHGLRSQVLGTEALRVGCSSGRRWSGRGRQEERERIAQRDSVATQVSPLPNFKIVVPDGTIPRPPLAQRNSVASRNSTLPYFKAVVPGGASPPPIPCAARFRRDSIFAAPKLQDCSARRRQPSPTPDAAQFRRQSKFDAPILQGCSARRHQPSATPGAAQFRRQSNSPLP